MRESTSLQWIYDQILSTYNLKTIRQEVLIGSERVFHFSEKFTYQHAYIQLKDFYMCPLAERLHMEGQSIIGCGNFKPIGRISNHRKMAV